MKKFIFFLFFILAAGGTGFFFGWAKMSVPAGSYGVMRTKTHGLEERVIKDGEFRWFWYKLIPKNAEIAIFSIDTVNNAFKSSGSLRSGDVYASFSGINADFSWDITGELSFNINPDHLPSFTDKENIHDNDGLRNAENNLADRIVNLALQRIINFIESGDEEKFDAFLIGAPVPELESFICTYFPEIENLICKIRVNHYPDFALYKSAKAFYEDYQERQSALIGSKSANQAENTVENRIRMDELARYGELLSRYPILLEYLALEKGLIPGKK